ncbi:HAMP domain-containing histidine kinase [Candidatus Saccharibacteria bacterium]|nr:HAMP domain-containing histidine kinase [Candidatus Saccharibacteria bacterium]
MDLEVNGILVAAHELKAPLVLMRQLALCLDPNDPKEVEKYQKKIVSVSERTLKQVSDLAKIARLEEGLFETEPVAVRNVCDEVERELENLFLSNSKKLERAYSNRSRLVVANHDLLFSIIYNFCSNAVKYSSSESTSRLIIKDKNQSVRVLVRDYGPSLPANVYREFTSGSLRAPVDISFRPDSSGLGLFIASKFADFMHARLGAIRHRDGTSFFVDLPVSRQARLF